MKKRTRGYITHDAMCKVVFALPGVLEAALKVALPQAVTALFAGPALQLNPVSISRRLRQAIGDLLFRIPFKPGPDDPGDQVYVPVEHKSRQERRTAYQLLVQQFALWQEYGGGRKGSLPKVIPLVIYCGKRPWQAASIGQLIDGKDAVADYARQLAPEPKYPVLDLGELPLEGLSGHPLAWAGCALLRGAMRPGEQADMMAPLLRRLPNGTDFENQALEYMLGRWGVGFEALCAAYRKAKPDRGDKPVQAVGEDLIGIGRAEGMTLGGAVVLTELLQAKFGTLPKWVHGQLKQASPEDLKAWTRAVLKAQSLDAVFGKAASKPQR